MDDFLAKPATLDDLREVLTRWLPTIADRTAAPPDGQARPAAQSNGLSREAIERIAALERPGSQGLVQRVASLFVTKSAQQLDAIRQAILADDLLSVRAQCHSLKSASAHVGAERLARVATLMEGAAGAQNRTVVQGLAAELYSAGSEAAAQLRDEIARRIA